MATNIDDKKSRVMLSYELGGLISITTDEEYLDVLLEDRGGDPLYVERLFAHNGRVEIYNLGAIIERFMEEVGTAYETFDFAVKTPGGNHADSWQMDVVYCNRFSVCTMPEQFLALNFLTTLAMRRVPEDFVLPLYLYSEIDPGNATVRFRWRERGTDEDPRTKEMTLPVTLSSERTYLVGVSASSLRARVAFDHQIADVDVEIVSVTVSVGQRSVTCYTDNAIREGSQFYFRNIFNVVEAANFPNETVAKTEVEHPLAVVANRAVGYDFTTVKTYETTTAGLTSDEAAWIDQLLSSYSVKIPVPNDCDDTEPYIFSPVVITDSTCEVSDTPAEPVKVKFTWRYAENRPLVELSAPYRIFREQYDLRYI